MKKNVAVGWLPGYIFLVAASACQNQNIATYQKPMQTNFESTLPTIGVLIFDEFLTNEVTAPLDVFTKPDSSGNKLFNVVLIAKEDRIYLSEEGLKVLPDFTIGTTPKLKVLVVPSSNSPSNQTSDTTLINFIKHQNKATDYIASHCAGAFMLGASGVVDGKEVVTYCTGSVALKEQFPKLTVLDDSKVSVVQDGKFISSNGNLVSYVASLDLLEQLTSKVHRNYVENQLLLYKLRELLNNVDRYTAAAR